MLKYVMSLGYSVDYRDENRIKITNKAGIVEEYEILEIFRFSSENRRMGIVVKFKATDMIVFYLKGAEVEMRDKIKFHQRLFVLEKSENLAIEGLRTLVICQKVMNPEDYETWNKRYKRAVNDFYHKDFLCVKIRQELETNMDLLGIIGIEDQLQDNISATVSSLRNAGINFWMLTGDKIKTSA